MTSVVAAAWPLAVRAQQTGKLPRIGMLWPNSAEAEKRIGGVAELHARLAELGYVDGRTVIFEERFADGDAARLADMAAELVRLDVDVILTGGEGTFAAARATNKIPIVTNAVSDPVALGLAASLAHPGGNVTGLTGFVPQIMSKRLELLKQCAPSLRSAGLITLKGLRSTPVVFEAMTATAKANAIELSLFEEPYPPIYEQTFATAGIGGFVILDTARAVSDFDALASLASRYRLPTASGPLYPRSGGLLGYGGVDVLELFRASAIFVDKILKGAKAGDIPFEQPTRFHLAVNLKTAAALGLDIPATILAAADEVIE